MGAGTRPPVRSDAERIRPVTVCGNCHFIVQSENRMQYQPEIAKAAGRFEPSVQADVAAGKFVVAAKTESR